MADEIKFTEEEIKSLNELSQNYQRIQLAFGQFKVQHLIAEQQMNALEEAEMQAESDYSDLQEKERELVQQLNEKYGPGSLDPATGVFTPSPASPTEETASEEK